MKFFLEWSGLSRFSGHLGAVHALYTNAPNDQCWEDVNVTWAGVEGTCGLNSLVDLRGGVTEERIVQTNCF